MDEGKKCHRTQIVKEALNQVKLSGYIVTPDAQAIAQEWVDGKITIEEMVQKVKDLHDVTFKLGNEDNS